LPSSSLFLSQTCFSILPKLLKLNIKLYLFIQLFFSLIIQEDANNASSLLHYLYHPSLYGCTLPMDVLNITAIRTTNGHLVCRSIPFMKNVIHLPVSGICSHYPRVDYPHNHFPSSLFQWQERYPRHHPTPKARLLQV